MRKLTFEFPLLCAFLLLSPLYSNAAATHPKLNNKNNAMDALVNKACSRRTDDKLACINYLKSNPKVMAAATSKPLDVALAIIQSGADEAKKTQAYLSKPKGKLSPQAIQAYNFCKTEWDTLASGLEWSVKTIKEVKGYATETADYDLMGTLEHGRSCATKLVEAQIKDPVITKGLENAQLAVVAALPFLSG
ncbi:uncharacterized protein LOC132048675 [Lycium ferocissimum]|uniref:uncharacterized protein LOC132048675 n=1 Tax=Lycium ferocissimum TaxID=112874 RepID=UPI002814C716|nr:uncharacterized protein LOC132048675 [Lycium ferocissimum]